MQMFEFCPEWETNYPDDTFDRLSNPKNQTHCSKIHDKISDIKLLTTENLTVNACKILLQLIAPEISSFEFPRLSSCLGNLL